VMNVLITEDGVHTKNVEGLIQMGECMMKIEKPWEEFYCDKCVHCFQGFFFLLNYDFL
jgi:hypothetical protein